MKSLQSEASERQPQEGEAGILGLLVILPVHACVSS